MKKTNNSFGINDTIYSMESILNVVIQIVAMQWHGVLKESSSPDSFKEKYLRALRVSVVRKILPFQGRCMLPFLGMVVD